MTRTCPSANTKVRQALCGSPRKGASQAQSGRVFWPTKAKLSPGKVLDPHARACDIVAGQPADCIAFPRARRWRAADNRSILAAISVVWRERSVYFTAPAVRIDEYAG